MMFNFCSLHWRLASCFHPRCIHGCFYYLQPRLSYFDKLIVWQPECIKYTNTYFFWIRKFTITFSPSNLHTLCTVWSNPTMPVSGWCRVWKAMSLTWIFLRYIPYPEELDPALAPGCVQWMGPQQPNLRDSNWVEGLYRSYIHSLLWGWSISLHRPHFPDLTLN